MISRKYSKDYKLTHTVQENGKIKTDVKYVGTEYIITDEENFKKNRKIFLMLAALCWIFFIFAIVPQSTSSRTFYIIVPFVSCAIPLFFLTGSIIDLFQIKSPITRMQADKINRTLPAQAFAFMLLSGAAFFGFAISCIINFKKMIAGDLIYGISSFCVLALSAVIFSLRKKICAKEK